MFECTQDDTLKVRDAESGSRGIKPSKLQRHICNVRTATQGGSHGSFGVFRQLVNKMPRIGGTRGIHPGWLLNVDVGETANIRGNMEYGQASQSPESQTDLEVERHPPLHGQSVNICSGIVEIREIMVDHLAAKDDAFGDLNV